MIRPYQDAFVQWFKNKQEYMDYYWIKTSWFNGQRYRWKLIIAYMKIKSRAKRWRSFQRVYINTYEILRRLESRRILDVEKIDNWRYLSDIRRDRDWIPKLSKMSPELYNRIREKIWPIVADMIKDHWTQQDKRIAGDILKPQTNDRNANKQDPINKGTKKEAGAL